MLSRMCDVTGKQRAVAHAVQAGPQHQRVAPGACGASTLRTHQDSKCECVCVYIHTTIHSHKGTRIPSNAHAHICISHTHTESRYVQCLWGRAWMFNGSKWDLGGLRLNADQTPGCVYSWSPPSPYRHRQFSSTLFLNTDQHSSFLSLAAFWRSGRCSDSWSQF